MDPEEIYVKQDRIGMFSYMLNTGERLAVDLISLAIITYY
jgi:hypothetical protein